MKKAFVVVLASVSLTFVLAVSAYAYPWETGMGPGGGSQLMDLSLAPSNDNVLYLVGDWVNIFRSTDGGETWKLASDGLTSTLVFMTVVDPQNPNIVYAAGQMGVHKSTDYGDNWVLKRNGFPAEQPFKKTTAKVRCIAIAPKDGNIIYAGINNDGRYEGGNDVPANNGLYKSTDQAEHWTKLAAFPVEGVRSITVDPSNSDVVWAGTESGVYRSKDGGATWSSMNGNLPSHPKADKIIIDYRNPDKVYVSLSNNNNVWKTVDGGATWSSASNGITGRNTAPFSWLLEMHPTNPDILYYLKARSGLFKTIDGGEHWTPMPIKPASQAATWENGSTGTGYWMPEGLCVSRQNPDKIYLLPEVHVLKTTDGGVNWRVMDATKQPGTSYWRSHGMCNEFTGGLNAIAFDPNDAKYVYAVCMDSGRFLKSIDGGTYWKNSDEHPEPAYWPRDGSVVVDPEDGSCIYRGNTVGRALLKSVDRGETWSEVLNKEVREVVMAPGGTPTARTLYVGTVKDGIYKSTNSGASFAKVDSTPGNDCDIIVDKSDPNLAYAFYTYGKTLYRTTDGAVSWSSFVTGAAIGANGITSFAIDPRNSSVMYIGGGMPPQAYKSTDGGAHWSKLHDFYSAGGRIRNLLVSPYDSNDLFCYNETWEATGDRWLDTNEIYMSRDAGVSWFPVGKGISGRIGTIVINPHAPEVWCGGSSIGICKIAISALTP